MIINSPGVFRTALCVEAQPRPYPLASSCNERSPASALGQGQHPAGRFTPVETFQGKFTCRVYVVKQTCLRLCPMTFQTGDLSSLLKLQLINVWVILNISAATGAFFIVEVRGGRGHRWELLSAGSEVWATGREPVLPCV